MDQPKTQMLRPGEAAAQLGIDIKTLYRWAKAERIGCVQLGAGRHRRYRAADIRDLIARGTHPRAPEGGQMLSDVLIDKLRARRTNDVVVDYGDGQAPVEDVYYDEDLDRIVITLTVDYNAAADPKGGNGAN